MGAAIELIDPITLSDAFERLGRKSNVAQLDELWDEFGKKTAQTVSNGARLLAALWDGAWKVGRGNRLAAAKLKRIPASQLQKVYEDHEFLTSYTLDEIGQHLRG